MSAHVLLNFFKQVEEEIKCEACHARLPLFVCLFVCFALRPKSTSMVMAGWSVHLLVTTPFSYASLNKQLTSTLCTYFPL